MKKYISFFLLLSLPLTSYASNDVCDSFKEFSEVVLQMRIDGKSKPALQKSVESAKEGNHWDSLIDEIVDSAYKVELSSNNSQNADIIETFSQSQKSRCEQIRVSRIDDAIARGRASQTQNNVRYVSEPSGDSTNRTYQIQCSDGSWDTVIVTDGTVYATTKLGYIGNNTGVSATAEKACR